jgi:Tol biopolymer transport system component
VFRVACTLALVAGCGAPRSGPPARTARAGAGASLDPACGCTTVGDYLAPDVAKPSETSGTYELAPPSTLGDQVTLTIRRKSNHAQVFTTTISQRSAWGFSPDGSRFYYSYLEGPTPALQTAFVVNLAATAPRAVPFVEAMAVYSSTTVFSPDGRYLLYAAMTTADSVTLEVVDASSGVRVYPALPPGSVLMRPPVGWSEDSVDVAGWGFSPDGRTFTYAYLDAGIPTLVVANVDQSRETIRPSLGPSARWGFSPCGDVFALDQLPSQYETRLYDPRTGKQLGTWDITPAPVMTHRATGPDDAGAPSSQVLRIQSGTTQTVKVLVPNTAAVACSTSPGGAPAAAQLDALTLSPTSVLGGGRAVGTVTLTAPAPVGDALVLLSVGNSAAAVPPSARVPAGARTTTFPVTTRAVTASTQVAIDATYGPVTRSATLQVTAPPPPPPRTVTGLELSRATAPGGADVVATVTVSGSAGNATVTLSTDAPTLAAVPATITVPAGVTTGSFLVSTRPVVVPATVQVTASAGGASATVALQLVRPDAVQAQAVVQDPACLGTALRAGDDLSSAAVALPSPLTFFGATYASLFVNTNGTVSFGAPTGAFTPSSGCGFADAGSTKPAPWTFPASASDIVVVSPSAVPDERVVSPPLLSGDGTWMAFKYTGARLADELYLVNLETGELARTFPQGPCPSCGWIAAVAMSADARFVAFMSKMTDVVAPACPYVYPQNTLLYVQDLSTGAIVRATRCDQSFDYRLLGLSGDGRYAVVYDGRIRRLDLAPAWDGGVATSVVADVTVDGYAPWGANGNAAISHDGARIAFDSFAANQAAGVTGGTIQVFVGVLDAQGAGTTLLVSAAPDGTPGNADSYHPTISGDGRWVVFFSRATNLVASDYDGALNLFARDLETGQTLRVTDAGWDVGTYLGYLPAPGISAPVSDDGWYVAFTACNAHIVPEDVDEVTPCRVYLRDLQGGTTRLVSSDANGIPTLAVSGTGAGNDQPIAISGDGRRVAFISNATDLVPNYSVDGFEMYVKQMLPPP